ncbi:transposase [Sphingobacterium anhuiense]|uniref:Mutator family transposase n=1 Tax=Sphingobacterium anhuiense TaxID=493780 RepID=A0ABW5YTK7_9SPHI
MLTKHRLKDPTFLRGETGKKYPVAAKSWMDSWTNLSTFFEYDEQVRKTIYTTNPIEGMHRQIRKITKSKGAFSYEQALMKLMFLIIKDIYKKWTMPMYNWGLTISQLYIKFIEKLKLDRGF